METLFQILLYGGLFFLMMRFGCGKHMFGHGSGDKKDAHAGGHGGGCGGGKWNSTSADSGLPQNAPPEKDVDPVCGKTVSTNEAKASLHNDLVYFFCSHECRETFESAPTQYIGREKKTASPRLGQFPAEDGGHG